MEVAIAIALVLIGLLAYLWKKSDPYYWSKRGIKHLVPYPVVGNSFQILSRGHVEFFKHLYRTAHPDERLVGFHMFMRPMLLIRCPDLVQEITTSQFINFTGNGLDALHVHDLFKGNLIFSKGDRWRALHHHLSPFFTPSKVKSMLAGASSTTMAKAVKFIEEAGSKPINAIELTKRITTDFIAQGLFGVETDAFEPSSFYMTAAEALVGAKFFLKMLVNTTFTWMYRLFRIESVGNNYIDFIKEVIFKTIKFRKENNVHREDFVQTMSELIDKYPPEKVTEVAYEDGTPVVKFDEQTVAAQAYLLYAAGYETSAVTISFALYELSMEPDMQVRCREEIKTVLSKKGRTEVKLDDIPDLPYLQAVVNETLRKYPAAPITPRLCTKSTVIGKPNDNFFIEEGTLCMISQYSVHHDPHHFPNPDKFRPERFLNDEIKNNTYFPFQLGPRACLGTNFAKLEIMLVMANLLQAYGRISLNRRTQIPIGVTRYHMDMLPSPGVWLHFEK